MFWPPMPPTVASAAVRPSIAPTRQGHTLSQVWSLTPAAPPSNDSPVRPAPRSHEALIASGLSHSARQDVPRLTSPAVSLALVRQPVQETEQHGQDEQPPDFDMSNSNNRNGASIAAGRGNSQ